MAKRRSIEIDGFKHSNPIPGASIVGNLMMSSIIAGRDPKTGKLPETLDGQLACLFGHVRAFVEAAGGTPEDIVKLNFWIRAPHKRDAINAEWVKMFPDAHARPARHTQALAGEGDALVQCDVTAVIGAK
ncbi:MAG: RidA family protein [Alphaproteobacteria bacterium]|nr:RidA family protein [Alphaproteobacteria bacterium]MCW5741415.1 RidA family protein [Alphaproteobacteria bacterium]